jgi:hypothetical protein
MNRKDAEDAKKYNLKVFEFFAPWR